MNAVPLHAKDSDVKLFAQDYLHEFHVGHVFLDARRRRLVFLNQAARVLHTEGVPMTPADLAGKPLHREDGSPVNRKQLPLIAAWRSGKPAEGRFLVPGTARPTWQVHWTATPLHDHNGKLLGVIGSVQRGPFEPDTRHMAELAHDLRTPLQSLRLLCALVERMPAADADMRKALQAISSVADRAVQIALDLLEVCRGPIPKIGAEEAPWFSLEPLLVSLAAEQTVTAEAKGIGFTSDFTAVRGWDIKIDRARLGRVLSNVLVNAVRYTPRGRVNFTAAWRDESGKQILDLGVTDTGPGITNEEQESIFQAYERGKAGKKSGDSSGSGLGLAVVDHLVEELGLSLDVYSQFGQGSAFHLLVPAALLRPTQNQ